MKKILIFVLTAVTLFSLAACGRQDEAPVEDTTPSTNANDMPTVDRNVPDPKVNDKSTDDDDSGTDGKGNDQTNPTENDQGGILDDAMDKITGKE